MKVVTLPGIAAVLVGLTLLPLADAGLAESGPQLAQRLNASYARTLSTCNGRTAPYHCSGVMLKQVAYSDRKPFWRHSDEAVQRGGERFDFLRADIVHGPLSHPGYLFSDRDTARSQDRDYLLLGDDGMSRPPELVVRNWNHDEPLHLPLQALYYLRSEPAQLGLVLSHQQAYYRATGRWLPILWLDPLAARPFGFEFQAQLDWGFKVAEQLNQRYEKRLDKCPDETSPVQCSGVLVRTVDYVRGDAVWMPDASDRARNGLSFSWVRRDMGTTNLHKDGELGFAFDAPGAVGQYPVELRCAYPNNGFTSALPDRCRATCAAEGISTVQAWMDKYDGALGSCALRDTPQDLRLLLDIRHAQQSRGINELVIAPWPEPMPADLPLAAFFYSIHRDGLDPARWVQRDFLQQTGQFKPVIRLDLGTTPGPRFFYSPGDQVF